MKKERKGFNAEEEKRRRRGRREERRGKSRFLASLGMTILRRG
jgi:hypothetical protein